MEAENNSFGFAGITETKRGYSIHSYPSPDKALKESMFSVATMVARLPKEAEDYGDMAELKSKLIAAYDA